MCRDIGNYIGMTPGKVKEAIKQDYFGLDEWRIGNTWYRGVRPSESAGMAEYADLITFTYQWAAENADYIFPDEHEVSYAN